MVLHMLYGQQQLKDCLALLTPRDTLLVMDASVLQHAGRFFRELPCEVVLLEGDEPGMADHDGITIIDAFDWFELVKQHAHSMSWS